MSFADRLAAAGLGVLEALADRVPYIVMGLIVVLVSWWLSRMVVRVVRAALARTSTEGHVDLIVARTAGAATMLVGGVVALGVMGVQVSALVTSLGLTAVTVGFALKDVLANSMAGVLLLLQRPFTLGDSVSVAGVEGAVRDIRVRDTLVEQPDGRMVYVPNATVFNAAITNKSVNRRRRVEVLVHVPVSGDLEQARRTALASIEGVDGMMDDTPAEARYVRTGVASVVLAVRRWVDTDRTPFGVALDDCTSAVFAGLREEGVGLAEAE